MLWGTDHIMSESSLTPRAIGTPTFTGTARPTGSPKVASYASPFVAVLVAWILSLPGDPPTSGVSVSVAALSMVAITVVAALSTPVAGVATSIAAALALNWFHTQPYRTFRISDSNDFATVALLAAIGLATSSITAFRVSARMRSIRVAEESAATHALEDLLATNQPANEVWRQSIGASANDLRNVQARLTPSLPNGLPIIGRRSTVDDDHAPIRFSQPGAAFRLRDGHPEGRWLVITPHPGSSWVEIDRRAVTSFADSLELAIASVPVANVSPPA
jgi:hypothetical protein